MSVAVSTIGHLSQAQPFRVVPRDIAASGLQQASVSRLAIIDDRALDRECLAQSLIAHGLNMNVELFSTISMWRKAPDPTHAGILINIGRGNFCEASFVSDVRQLVADYPGLPVVILAENRDLRQIMQAFELGVRGYISSAIGLSVCVGAISLAVAGGVFISAENLDDLRQLLVVAENRERRRAEIFTDREVDVIDALTKGKPNKIIAYELNLRESTVKVHVRNIMKKLQARNRTEIIFKISAMFDA
ncbi:response regulator transcription factor [Rhizobium sp. NFR03]|uniref:LuxR C-terminal-related transcriptional regulator n=1 Tax=Rhizobium sp. NFR03 TaxID=1566263 RepID=UPI0008D05CB9|nr:response regulator transcription factor [Rhizobium sp. NFR03]SES42052.1 DNA-binding response regulator, NarL/FixJ family, contains REC and HTH domains [Rhizobium sp. NFR03]